MNTKKKKGLGRGLSALFGDEKSENKPKTKNVASNTKALIGDLARNPYPVSYTHLTLPTTPYV